MHNLESEKVLKKECFDKKFYSFGTAKIFEKRANSLKYCRNVITFLGLLSPILIGAFVASFSVDSDILKKIILPIAGTIAVIQAILSLWSIIARWDEKYYESMKGIIANTTLSSEFEELALTDERNIKKHIVELRRRYKEQEQLDSAQHITDKEKRFGMRRALYQYQSKCATCKKQPRSLKSTNCDTCGNF